MEAKIMQTDVKDAHLLTGGVKPDFTEFEHEYIIPVSLPHWNHVVEVIRVEPLGLVQHLVGGRNPVYSHRLTVVRGLPDRERVSVVPARHNVPALTD